MTEADEPIAYTALQHGTSVRSSDDQELGTVAAVLSVPEEDLFDGIVIHTHHGVRFVDADQVQSIFTSHVRTTVSAAEASSLQAPDQNSPVYDANVSEDLGGSLADHFGRLFGRGKWTRER